VFENTEKLAFIHNGVDTLFGDNSIQLLEEMMGLMNLDFDISFMA